MVSVVVPNYNHCNYLRQRIDSVLNQTFQDIEVIILDDYSTDNSRDVIETYRCNPKVSKIVYNETNSGSVFRQWKKGIQHAKGEYIWIAESDDYADRDFLKELTGIITQKESIAIAYCDSAIISEDRSVDSVTFSQSRNEWFNVNKWEHDYINTGRSEISENLLQMCTINNASAVLFRRDSLLAVDPFDLELRYTGDWYLYLKLCSRYDIAYSRRALNFYRQHSANSSQKLRHNLTFVKEYFLIYNWVYNSMGFISRKRIIKYFMEQTRHSLVREWTKDRLLLYYKLFRLNSTLFILMIFNNVVEPFSLRLKKTLCP